MKTVLFIAPHLSTGGLPQYLFKKIESLINTYKIYVIEYEDITGGVLVIQKNRIFELLHENLISLPYGSDKSIILDTINQIKPNIIHFEEMPEYFMNDNITKEIYKPSREYKIFETCHDSSFNPTNKRFKPDKFILVSNYQVNMLSSLNIPAIVVEYPIEKRIRPERNKALDKLNLDPGYKHVLHVGLFTPRKNQKEFFDYAERFKNQKVIFHSIGNMADNFKDYWEPLLANKPNNLMIWGERNDVDDFYAAMDLFLFTSKGTINDKETMPLVIREAISWNIPTLIYNLPVYENYFYKYENISYLDFEDFNKNIDVIEDLLVPEEKDKTVVIISTYPTSQSTNDLTLEAIKAAKNSGYDVILTSHAPISIELQENSDFVIYDSNNLLTYHDYYSSVFFDYESFRLDMNIRTENNHLYHGPAVYINYYNGLLAAKNLGYKNAICYNFDMIISDTNVLNVVANYLSTYPAVFNITNPEEGNALRTVFYGTNIEFFLDRFPRVTNEYDYISWKAKINSESNGLENIYFNTLKYDLNRLKILNDQEFYLLLENCRIDVCSMVEYFNVVSVTNEPNKFAIWFSTANQIDSRKFTIEVVKDNKIIFTEQYDIIAANFIYKIFEYIGECEVILTEGNIIKKIIKINDEYMENKLKINGSLSLK